jgi:hypothetical protein
MKKQLRLGLTKHASASSPTVQPAVDESPLAGPIAGHRELGVETPHQNESQREPGTGSSTATARARSNHKRYFGPEMTEDFAL